MATEKTLQAKIVKYLKSQGVLCYKFASPAHRGVPDLVCIRPGGSVFFIEVKHPNGKGKLSKLQAVCINEMKGKGAEVYVCDNIEAIKELID